MFLVALTVLCASWRASWAGVDRGYLRGRLIRKEGRGGEATGCRQRRWIADILLFMPSELPCERSRHRAHRYVQP